MFYSDYKLLFAPEENIEFCSEICVHWISHNILDKHKSSASKSKSGALKQAYRPSVGFCFLFSCSNPHLRKSRLYINRRVCYSCTVVGCRKALFCGMQFKITCQQMPCVIWHCRNLNFCSLFENKVTVYFFFFGSYFVLSVIKGRICTHLVPLSVDSAASCCNYFFGDNVILFLLYVILLIFVTILILFFFFYLFIYVF